MNRIKNDFRSSKTKRLLDFLFFDSKELLLKDTILGKFLERINLRYVPEILTGLAISLVLYESLLQRLTSVGFLSQISLVLLFISFVIASKNNIGISKLHLWFLLFLLTSLISAIFAQEIGVYMLQGWLIFAQLLLVVMVGQAIGEKIIKFLLIAILPMNIYAFYQFFSKAATPSTWFSAGEAATTRAFAFLGSPNVLGILTCILTIASLGLFLKNKNNIFLLSALFNLFVVFLTLSRTAWLSLLLAISFMVLMTRPKLILLSPVAFLLLLESRIRDRIFFAFSPSYLHDSSLDGRIWAWINGLHILKKNPLVGTGPGSYGGQLALSNASPIYLESIQNGYTALYFTDNQILEILIQTGLLGIIFFLFFSASLLIKLIRKYSVKKDIIILTSASVFVAFFVSGLFANVLEFGAVALPAGLIIGAGLNE